MQTNVARLIIWSVAVLLPIAGAATQHYVRYKLQKPDILFPWWSLGALVHFFFLGTLLWLSSRKTSGIESDEQSSETEGPKLFAPPFYLVGAVYCIYLIFEIFRLRNMLWFQPINPLQADMIPIIQQALSKFWHQGSFPYTYVEVGHWTSWLTFQPGHWLPFSIPFLSGVDIRVWQTFSLIAMSALLVFQGFWFLSRSKDWRGICSAIVVWVIPVILLRSWSFKGFLPAVHVAGFWFNMVVWAMLLIHGYRKSAALALGFCFITRPYMIFVGPLYLIYLWRTEERKTSGLGLGLISSLPFLFMMLPLLIVGAKSVVLGMLDAYENLLAYQIEINKSAPYGFALTGFLYHFDLFAWKRVGALILEVILLAGAVKWLKNDRDMVYFTAVAIFFFNSFAIIPYFYIFIAPAVLLCMAPPIDELYISRSSPKKMPLLLSASSGFCLYGLFIISMIFFPPKKPAVAQGGPPGDLSAYRLTLGGMNSYGWISNGGETSTAFADANAYIALPVQDRSSGRLEIDWNLGEHTGNSVVEIALNHRVIDVVTIPEGANSFKSESVIPNASLFFGTNLVRFTIREGEPSLISISRCSINK